VNLLGILTTANANVMKYKNSQIFRVACSCLRGQLEIALLSLFLTKDSAGIKDTDGEYGNLPIHTAAIFPSLDELKFLHEAYPESLSVLTKYRNNLLHLVF
jgi:hypothetical protein